VEALDGLEVHTRTIGFVDLVDSTSLSTALSPRVLVDLLVDFEVTASDLIAARGGRVVKLIGDEVMFVAVDPSTATDIGLALIETLAEHPVVPPVRVGVASGDVVLRDGDFSGAVVHLAARAVKVARPGSLLVDERTQARLDDRFRARLAGEFSLKGFDQRSKLFRVRRRD
jgi:adenylate cyclase